MKKWIGGMMATGAAALACALVKFGGAALAVGCGDVVILGAFGVLGALLLAVEFWSI